MVIREDLQRAVGSFPDRAHALPALEKLKSSGFDMDNASVISRQEDNGEDIAGATVEDEWGNRAGQGRTIGATAGGVAGGLAGLLVGVGTLSIPGVGPVIAAGAIVTAIAAILRGGAAGAAAGSLVGALVGIGIPEDRAAPFQSVIEQGGYLVLLDGNREQIQKADLVLQGCGVENRLCSLGSVAKTGFA